MGRVGQVGQVGRVGRVGDEGRPVHFAPPSPPTHPRPSSHACAKVGALAKTTSCATAAVAVGLMAGFAGAANSMGNPPDAPVVRVYDSSSGHGRTRATAIRTAASIVAEAGLAIDWTDCTRASQAGACNGLRGPNDLIVRIMPVAVSGSPGLKIRDQSKAPLGFSVVDPVVGAGAIAMVFLDRVLVLSQRTGADPGRLLGRAIAHEIGHLLLGTTAHSRNGLMREIWTDQEIVRNTPEDWIFAERDRLTRRPH